MWLSIFKFLIAPGLVCYCIWDLYSYNKALNNWIVAKGTVVRRKIGQHDSLIIRFKPDKGKEIEFESENFPLLMTLYYSAGDEVAVLYPHDIPGKAIMKTSYVPFANLTGIIVGVMICCTF